ncbi:hypothetical protein ACLMJK_008711 [Lecanora helva]
MENQPSNFTIVPAPAAQNCKLPLLDGGKDNSANIISAEVELQNAAKIHEVCHGDRSLICGILCTAWTLVLRCYTGQDELTFRYKHGVNRPALLLRTILDEESKLSDCAEKAKDAIGSIDQKRQDAAADAITATGNADVSTAICIYDSDSSNTLGAKTVTKGNITVHVEFRNKTPRISLESWSSDVSRAYLDSVASTLSHVLTLIVDSPDLRVKDVDYVSDRNRRQLHEWNDINCESVEKCVTDVIYEQVEARPDAEAICGWDGSFSYRSLWKYVQILAQRLVRAGIGPGDVVPLCFEKSIWAPVAMLAVMEAGAGFCPLDSSQPVARLRSLIERLEARIVLCSRKYQKTAASLVGEILSIDAETFDDAPNNLMDRLRRPTPSDIAYVLWTSGSTGEPKGVVIEHRAYCASAEAHVPQYKLNSESRMLQYASYVFDASIIEVLTPLMIGATVCVPSEYSRLNGLAEAMNQMRVTFAQMTPSVVNFLQPSDLPHLKVMLLMGEGMSRENMLTWTSAGTRLINAYGPAECSVAATLNPDVPFYGEPSLIGHPMCVKTWLVDPENHDRLVPPGCVGELLIEGATLARGYLNDPERTKEAFIENPAWVPPASSKQRMYKTGDLARYHISNGMLYFIGRKDTQVKYHGQRIELGDIEHHLQACPSIERAMVVMPKAGLCSKRLVAAMSLEGGGQSDDAKRLQLIDMKARDAAKPILEKAQDILASQLPAFMIPSIWLVFEKIPILKSGKLDRKALSSFITDISDSEYSQVVGSSEVMENEKTATELESQLRIVWGRVLNLQPNQISLKNQSFLSLGGDSISAMMVKSHCKKCDIGVAVQDILRAKSITHLAGLTQAVNRSTAYDEKVDEDFDLAPIQSLYFELPRDKGHFNQSFFLRVTRPVEPAVVHQTAKTIVNRHSMLRARFSNTDDEWKQRITTDIVASYSFNQHHINTKDDAVPAMSKSQASLNPVEGPLFAVDFFDVDGGDQLLFMTAHHLVVDLVSWRVILEEVEEILTNPTVDVEAEPCLSFQAWQRMQSENAQKTPVSVVLPTNDVPSQSFEYWGVKVEDNTYGNVTYEGFELDEPTTAILMSKCHEALRTEPLDILLAAMIHSYSKVFTDRTPAIFNEGHGREAWDRSLDLSRTVGWFTTMYPVYVAAASTEDFISTLRRVKDYRRSVPGNGRPYFASRLLTAKGAKKFGGHWPLEITFNYLGTYQQLERDNALLVPAEEMAGEARAAGGKADYGFETPRFGLFEISAVIVQGKLRYSFTFNQNTKHLDKVRAWISGCQETLRSMPIEVSRLPYSPTLSDFPLLSIDYSGLEKLASERLPSLGVEIGNAEDIYRCSQVQQGLLISTKRDAGFYAVEGTYEVKPADDRGTVHEDRLVKAWQTVVKRHPSLRTLFIESLAGGDALYDQLVLRKVDTNIECLVCASGAEVDETFVAQGKMKQAASTPAHRFTTCQTKDGRLFFKLEISHTLIDGASMSQIYKEIVASYEGKLAGEHGPLYSDYIAFLQTQPLQAGINYWKSFLSGVEPTTFPVLKDSSDVARARELRSQRFNYDNLEGLQEFCQLHGVTMNNVFHLAWALTLQAYTGAKDVCYGYLMSTRDEAVENVDELVGYLVNMVVCRVVLSPDDPLTTVMSRIQKDLADAQTHRQTALSEVLHALKMAGDALFNTSLSYRKLPLVTTPEKHEITLEDYRPYYDPTEYNLSVNIEVSEEAATIDLDYWTDCLSESHATNVAHSFFSALNNIIDHADDKVGQLNNVSENDKQSIMSWNSQIPSTIHKTVHEVVSEQVAQHQDKQAICGWDASLTYKELDALANKLAAYLNSLGVGPETFVCLCCEKSAYTPVTMLGVLKAGGAFASLDPMHPTSAHEMRIKDSNAKVVLTSPCYSALFSGMGLHVVAVDRPFLDQLNTLERGGFKFAEHYNPCCTIYTSGSTGVPKGVVLEHSALVTSAAAHGSAMGFDDTTRTLQYASYTFDNCLEETFTTLMRGGTVCVPSDHDRMNDVAGVCTRMNCNFIDLTPTVAMYLNPAEMRCIKKMSLGGEALTKAVLEVWGEEVEIFNQYGPCECSINSTYRTNLKKTSDPTSIGRSVGNVSWLVDPNNHDRLVPVGCEGELCIEGPILARGYLNDKDKTAKAFIEDAEWTREFVPKMDNHAGPRRMYKTGDLVRYNSDGTMDYCGRKDHQIKLHGQRIELGEIEYHIRMQVPSTWQFGVELVVPHGLKMLALFACPQKQDAIPIENNVLPMSGQFQKAFKDLEAALIKSLPKHMVPSMYIPLAKLPLSASGKLDRKSLKALVQTLTENQVAVFRLAGNSGREPSSEVEKTLAGLWEKLLNLEQGSIGMESQFFRMGGDSIAAIRLVTAARAKGIGLSVAGIFRNATLTEMCNTAEISNDLLEETVITPVKPYELLPPKIPASQVIGEVSNLCRVEPNEVVDVYPCTPMQEGLIALSSKKPGAYVAQTTYKMTNINVQKFKDAWQTVVSGENILRTRIVFTESLGFMQTIVTKPIEWFEPPDLDHLFDAKEFQGAYSGGGLSNYATVKGRNENEFFFVWTIHHALYDRWSIPLILQKVRSKYFDTAEVAVPATKAPLYPQFIKFLLGENKSESAMFWQSRLAETTSPQFPPLPNPTYQPSATGRYLRYMPVTRGAGTEITMPMLVRAAWGLTISAYANSEDVVFGEIFSGRDTPLPGIEDMTGPAFATVPIRVQAKRDIQVGKYLKKFQEDFTEALPYQHMGLLRIKRIDDNASNACEFQNLISINNEVPDTSDLFEVEQAAGSGSAFFTYGLTVAFDIHATEIELDAHYDPACISQWQVERLLRYFEVAVTKLVSSETETSQLGDMRMLLGEDEATIKKWNNVAPNHIDKCVHDVVRENAEKLPLTAPAVCAWDAQLTYRELDSVATSFAHHLRSLGIGQNSYVPVCFEKTALVVVSMLAIMKLGAAFVPIDGEAPKSRLQGIVDDAEATHVLCSPKFKEVFASLGAQAVVVDHPTIKDSQKNQGPLSSSVTGSDIAYIIFTSGSTGKPKGTLVSHTAFSSGALAHGPAMGMQSSSRVLQFASYTFDASVMEILSALLVGGCVCIPDDKTRLNDVAKAINDLNVNWALLTPSFAKMLSPTTVPGLKTLVLGGEAMSQSDVVTWASKTRLVNAYGPSEAAVVATVQPNVRPDSKFSSIGKAVGSRCFIVNQHNHEELVPVGAAGELVIYGPILASGYLKEKAKTEAAFVPAPAWLGKFKAPGMRSYSKIYKTGDLVKYAEDGSFLYSGRKDNQTKLHGQRLELGEVEHHLRQDPEIQHALALIPASGHFAKRLVAVLSFKKPLDTAVSFEGLDVAAQEKAAAHVDRVGDYLRSTLQPFMVPSNWISLIRIPMLPSGKLDGKRVKAWLEDMPESVNVKISGGSDAAMVDTTGSTEIELRLQKIWSKALDLPLEKLGLEKNFLFLGGDSISALQVLSQCRGEGINTTVQDIIRSKSIRHLASTVSLEHTEVQYAEEEFERAFGLSPMQSLYFDWVGNERIHHFNQSTVLRLVSSHSIDSITSALKALVSTHSMLRATFSRDDAGRWEQRVHKESDKSYRYTLHPGQSQPQAIETTIEKSQKSLNIEHGPIFAADLFELDESGSRVLSLVAHHLVIDIVSWNIIQQDLEALLTTSPKIHKSLPFQTWCHLQEEHQQAQQSKGLDFNDEIPVADLSYWGMEKAKNEYGSICCLELEVDNATTKNLLGPCNQVMGTELIDILLGSILVSFCKTFSDRKMSPTIFNEAHGREPWSSSLDVSHTVGWFTSISPVFLPTEALKDNDVVNGIRWVKDLRSRTQEKGRQYFAHRMLTQEGRENYSNHWPMEMAFNYSGQEKTSNQHNGTLQVVEGLSNKFDIDPKLPRFALFEISAGVFHDIIKISIAYPQNIRKQHSIKMWKTAIGKTLQRSSEELLAMSSKSTTDQFSLLPLTYKSPIKLQDRLNAAGIASVADVEDVFGSSPMQQGVLLSQVKNPRQYMYQAVFIPRLTASPHTPLSSQKLADAWRLVVQTHPSLRTVFIESMAKEGLMDQAVLKTVKPRIQIIQSHPAKAVEMLREQDSILFTEQQPHHQFTICETTTGKLFCKMELSHSLCDGTSVSIILKDLARFYNTQEKIEPAPTNRDYIAYITKSSYESNMTYWRRYLQHAEPCSFPSLLDGPVKQRENKTCQLKIEDLPGLNNFCATNGATMSNVLQLVWSLVLRVYTASDSVCFGYITSGRDVPVPEVQNAVGLFISMLVCRLELGDSLGIKEALEKIQSDYSNSMEHQAFSLSNMQHEMGGGQALFNTVFTFQRRFTSTDEGSEQLEFDVLSAYDPGEYPLTVNVEALEKGIDVQFNYWTDFLCETQANNISETFEQILLSIMQSPRTVSSIDLCSEKQQQRIFDWNDIALPKVDRCVHDIIYQQSQELPMTTPAICSWDEEFTYVKLMSLAKRLAKHLVARGVGPETYVPLCFQKSAWAVVAMLGVLEAGGAFVPVEPSHPDTRIQYIVSNVGAKLVLCSPKYEEKFMHTQGVETFVIDESFPRQPQPSISSGIKVTKPTPTNAAYLIFTSGTTGLPKGTIISHHAFATGATEHAPAILMRQKSRVLQFSNLCFDASVMEILTSLVTGSCICIPSDEERMNDITGAINRMNVTWTLLTPSVAAMLNPEAVPSLEVLVTGGEAMQTKHIAKWSSSASLVNAYGPSECAVIATTSIKVDLDKQILDEDSSNIGRGVGGRCWIVNQHDHNQLMPIGTIGELVVEGNTVARGYLNNEEKTSKAFVSRPPWMEYNDDEIASGHSKLIYKTGDLVRYNAQGDITYVARKDTQIKLNGLRIELGDIEHHVKQHLPERVESTVEMVAPAGQTTTLAAFIKLPEVKATEDLILPMSDELSLLAQDLKTKLTKALPGYMVPSLYFPVSHMPWTASGKLDRGRLRKAVTEISQEDSTPFRLGGVAKKKSASTGMEKKLQRLWASHLNMETEKISLNDNFFAIGGDSVIGMRLGAAARAEQISLSVFDIFRKPTLREMAEACTELEEESDTTLKPFSLLPDSDIDQLLVELSKQCRVDIEQVVDAYPCSPLQEGLITVSTAQPGAYVAVNTFQLPISVDLDLFKAAWQSAVAEMDILRTRIVHTSLDTFVQVVLKDEQIDWQQRSTSHLPEHNGGALSKFSIIEDGQGRYFEWSIHHAIYDGWSMPRMLQRVEDIYCQTSSFQPVQAPYAKYISYLQGVDKEASQHFWESKFENLQAFHIPTPPTEAGERKVDFTTLSHRVELKQKPEIKGVTMPTLIRAAWAILLSAYTGGSEDVVFGESLTGRDIPLDGIIDMLGPTLTTIPSRIRVKRESTVEEYLKEIHQMSTDVIPHQHIGLQNIKRLSDDTAMACNFQNLLVIQTAEEQSVDESQLWNAQDSGVSSKFFNYPLVIEAEASALAVHFNLHYNKAAVSEWVIQRAIHQLEHVLIGLCNSRSDAMVDDLEVLSPQDIETLREWNAHPPVAIQGCVHDLFLRQAALTPHLQAVCAWDGTFSYRQLKSQVMRLAGHLQRLGVKPESLVPFCMDKSRWAVVAQLGIMLAGGAMIPLDPTHPLSRHEDIIKDTNSKFLVCSPQYRSRYLYLISTIVEVDGAKLAELPEPSSETELRSGVTTNNAAYVIFTSGSTGRPKGVVVEHQAICTSSDAYCKAMLMDRKSRVFNFASFTFDVAFMESISPLTMGACVCIPNEEEKMTDLASAINSVQPTWAFLTPSVSNLLEPSDVPSLKVLVVGGEAMAEENIKKWGESLTLVNGYGPTEASVISVTNQNVSQQKNPKNIGFATDNSRAWITDSRDHDHLAAVGCVGELVLEGPILAREYLQDKEKTDSAFFEKPAWASLVGNPQRLYKTGDLVKYGEDGSIIFCGRKDNQIKLNGQRVELGEIEAKVLSHQRIQGAMIVLPKSGLCKNRLVAVVALADIGSSALKESSATSSTACALVQGSELKTAQAYLREVKEFLAGNLPAHMIPSTWAILESLPILVSGKADRKQVEKWIGALDKETFKQITAQESTGGASDEMTKTVEQLREIWSAVFNIPVAEVDPSSSFMTQGGDSLLSMSIVSRCRKIGIALTVQNVLQSKSLFQLAKLIDSTHESIPKSITLGVEEKADQSFDLSPIQKLYFKIANEHTQNARFNQSQILRVSRLTSGVAIKNALDKIAQIHSMFRAKFFRNESGDWQQKIVSSTSNAYHFCEYQVESLRAMVPAVAESQNGLDIQNGPLLAVDFFDTTRDGQIISLVAHHLVIDVVSWNIIIQQLEDLLTTSGETVIEKPLSFQTWLTMQQQDAEQMKTSLPFNIGRTDPSFWDMTDCSNFYGDTKTESFLLDKTLTEHVLGVSNEPYGTQPLELLLSTLAYSFSRVFPNRATPAIWNESHGRETWDSSIDLSGTIGWFTSLSPIYVSVEDCDEGILEVVKRTKDQRRSVNGRRLFASSSSAIESEPMEVLFNYTGRSQQSEGGDSLLQGIDIPLNDHDAKLTSDVGPSTPRLALFEVSAGVSNGQFKMSLIYNSQMKHQDKIHKWLQEWKYTLDDMTRQLMHATKESTLTDYPLLPTNHTGLARHIHESIPEAGISSIDDVEDMMVCAPMQDGLLLAQIRQPDNYLSYIISEVKPKANKTVDIGRLLEAWQKVVDHHQMLRTTFAYSVCKGHAFDQIVLKRAEGGAIHFKCADEKMHGEFANITLRGANRERRPTLPHQMSICTTASGKTFMKLELNHAVIDGTSVGLITRDLAAAYEDRLPEQRPLYSDYVRHIADTPFEVAMGYWMDHLKGVQRTILPPMSPEPREKKSLNATFLRFDRFPELQAFCRTNELTLSNVMLAAWAMVLRRYIGQDDVCFGNLSAGRDAPVDGIQDTVGAFINMLICRVNFSDTSSTLKAIFKKIQHDFIESLPHQHCPLAKIQHDLGVTAGEAMYNTACSLQKTQGSEEETGTDEIQFDEISGHDPTEYAVTVSINTAAGSEGACIKNWTSHVSVSQAEALSKAYSDVLNEVLVNAEMSIATFDEANPKIATKDVTTKPKGRQVKVKEVEVGSSDSEVEQPNFSASMYRNIVKDCVQEVVQQLLKSGQLGAQRQEASPMITKEVQKKVQKPIEQSDPTSKTLRSLWSTLLDIPEAKIHDNSSFLEVGGDSILAMELARNARNAGLRLTVADIFTIPIFSEMSQFISASAQKRLHQATSKAPKVDQVELTKQKVLDQSAKFSYLGADKVETFIQEYICPKIGVFRGGIVDVLPITDFQALSVTGAMLGSRWMLNYFFFDGSGYLDLQRLKQSVFKLVQNFDILRTVFIHCGDRFWQVVLRKLRPQFQVYDTEEDIDDFTRNLRESSIDAYPRLGEPFFQVSVVQKTGTNDHRIILRLSHAQYDGLCLPHIIECLKACYEGKDITPTPSFSNYVSQATGPANSESYDYWKELLRGSSNTSLVRHDQPSYDVSEVTTTTLKKTVKVPALKSKNLTPATILKAAWTLTLAQMSGKSDVVFGNLIGGRNILVDGVEDIVGPCVNIIPVRIRLEPKMKALDLLRQVQNQQVEGMSHECLGFREIIHHCTDWPEWSHFSSIVQHQNISQDMPLRLDGRQYKLGFIGQGDNLSDLNILSTPKEDDFVEVAIGFTENGRLPSSVVQKALDLTCSFAENLARNPNSTLPAFINDPNRKPMESLQESIQPATEQFPPPNLADMLRHLKKREVYDMVDILRRAWRIVLPKYNTISSEINLDTSFYSLGGDLIALGALVAFLNDEGYISIRLEDLVKRTRMGEQIALLSQQSQMKQRRKSQKEIGEVDSGESEMDPSSSSTLADTPDVESSPERQPAAVGLEETKTKLNLWRKMTGRMGIRKMSVASYRRS